MSPMLSSYLSVIIISLISVVGLSFIISRFPSFSKLSLNLVSIAVGCLLGDAFIHLLPEASHSLDNNLLVSLLTITGILIFFSIEKFVRWHHCHDPECHDHIVAVSVVGESFHNFIDGVIIAGSFMVDFKIGLATSLAVLLHEIPQEIGDFGIYLHQGLSLSKALSINLLSAFFALLGVTVTFIIGSSVANFSAYILPITAGGFIYLASSDLIPELHRHQSRLSSSLLQIILVIFGVTLMTSLLFLE